MWLTLKTHTALLCCRHGDRLNKLAVGWALLTAGALLECTTRVLEQSAPECMLMANERTLMERATVVRQSRTLDS